MGSKVYFLSRSGDLSSPSDHDGTTGVSDSPTHDSSVTLPYHSLAMPSMNHPTDWRRVWQVKSEEAVSDFELDRGRAPGEPEVENLSDRELLNFIDPKASETILDA